MKLELEPTVIKLNKIIPDDMTELVTNPKSERMTHIVIPKNIDIIGSNAFELIREEVETIDMSNSTVTIIEDRAFANMSNLKLVKLPKNLKYIRAGVFEHCINLGSISLPLTVTEIHRAAFKGCASLEAIYINDNCRHIASEAFKDCVNLKSVRLPAGNISVFSDTFSNCRIDLHIEYT